MPSAAMLHIGVASPNRPAPSSACRSPTRRRTVRKSSVTVAAESSAATIPPGTALSESERISQYAGTAAAITPGERPTASRPSAVRTIQVSRMMLWSRAGKSEMSGTGSPVRAMCHAAKSAE